MKISEKDTTENKDITHEINTTTTIEYNGKILFKYDAENHTLTINTDQEFLLDIGSIPVDLCFPIPGKEHEHYCFKQVSKVLKLEEENDGLIKRFSRFLKKK